MLAELLRWLGTNAVALLATAVAIAAHARIARTDRVVLEIEHVSEPEIDGYHGRATGNWNHWVRVKNRGRHDTEIESIGFELAGRLRPEEARIGEVKLARRITIKAGSSDVFHVDRHMYSLVRGELGDARTVVRDVASGRTWSAPFPTEWRVRAEEKRAQQS